MPKDPAKAASPVVPRVRRGYFESRYGQLHVHNAIPPGGGFDEGTSLLCLHATPRSGGSMLPLLTLMGMDRSVYAPDLPGYGNSDGPVARPAIADYATAVVDFCTTMRFRHLDVLGCQTGALVAAEVALALPNIVRRVVLIEVPLPDEAERENFHRAPWPVAAGFADTLANGPIARWGMQAAMQYPAAERLRLIRQPTLLVRSRDARDLDSARAHELLPQARSVEQAQLHGSDLFESSATQLSTVLREFLRG